MLGHQINDWRLVKLISERKLANVYLAVRGEERGALKLYRPMAPLRRVLREQESQQRFVHPRVANLLDHGVDPKGQVFLVTRFVEGVTLRQYLLDVGGILPWQQAVTLGSQIAEGLEVIHKHQLVHRDLKPENVMIHPGGSGLTLLDLGHALVMDLGRLTESGLVWGSAPYLSPEQAAGQPLDSRSDLYTLGVLLYELLVGRRPFESSSAMELMELHWTAPVEPPARYGLPAGISDLCLWLLAKLPERRPPSARVVCQALEGLLRVQAQMSSALQTNAETPKAEEAPGREPAGQVRAPKTHSGDRLCPGARRARSERA
jgi:serine/threonine-protein kinase